MHSEIITNTSHEYLSNLENYYGAKYRGFAIAAMQMLPDYRKDKLEEYRIQLNELILEYNRLLMIYSGIKYAEELHDQSGNSGSG